MAAIATDANSARFIIPSQDLPLRVYSFPVAALFVRA